MFTACGVTYVAKVGGPALEGVGRNLTDILDEAIYNKQLMH